MALRADLATDFDCLRNLAENQVHLWISFEDAGERSTSHLRNLLSVEERRLADRFQNAGDQRRYILAHTLVRLALSNYFPVAPVDWRFGRDRNGKPVITVPEQFAAIRFSLSHTRGLIACLITGAGDAGVDVEKIEANAELVSVAQKVLSASELRSLNELSHEEWTSRFYDLWTLKEAYGKARGVGLDLPTTKISFEIGREDSVRVRFDQEIPDDPSCWIFWLRHLPPDHVLSFAVRRATGETCGMVERIVNFDESRNDTEWRLSILSERTIPTC